MKISIKYTSKQSFLKMRRQFAILLKSNFSVSYAGLSFKSPTELVDALDDSTQACKNNRFTSLHLRLKNLYYVDFADEDVCTHNKVIARKIFDHTKNLVCIKSVVF